MRAITRTLIVQNNLTAYTSSRYMKNLFLILLFSSVAQFSSAQAVFAKDSSKWFHKIYGVPLISYVSGDTLLQGINAKKINQAALGPLYSTGEIYVYTASDTTFVYNKLFNRFTPLYIFNARAGDSICLPIVPPLTCGGITIKDPDSTFCFVVDSVGWLKYDTSMLKTFFTHPVIMPGVKHVYSYGGWLSGVYSERIGSVSGGILPHCMDCTYITVEACQRADSLRCYYDDQYTISLDSSSCAQALSTTEATFKNVDITIAPNPTSDYITVETPLGQSITKVEIINTQGKVLNAITSVREKIIVTQYPSGIYYLKLLFKDRTIMMRKIIVYH
ncbi:MAG TPA: T9SS type A sorting domain-containing protein [Flavipsychrobacter sp.]|nr:T9SS type A sorting domain-containing protein [Flavipsychrobacter sp.]